MEQGYFVQISPHHAESFKPAEKRGAGHVIAFIR
jgi:hypothetical protein